MKDIERIESQLDRVLAFFPRVDTKMSGIFAINCAMLTIAALNVEADHLARWYIAAPGTALIIGVGLSSFFLYRCNFPELRGGQGSLIYFSAIQNRTESGYKAELESASDGLYRSDMIGQIWRNSSILCEKYKAVSTAIRFTLVSFVPFLVLILTTAWTESRIPVVGS